MPYCPFPSSLEGSQVVPNRKLKNPVCLSAGMLAAKIYRKIPTTARMEKSAETRNTYLAARSLPVPLVVFSVRTESAVVWFCMSEIDATLCRNDRVRGVALENPLDKGVDRVVDVFARRFL